MVWMCLVEAGGNFSVQNGNPLELLQFSVEQKPGPSSCTESIVFSLILFSLFWKETHQEYPRINNCVLNCLDVFGGSWKAIFLCKVEPPWNFFSFQWVISQGHHSAQNGLIFFYFFEGKHPKDWQACLGVFGGSWRQFFCAKWKPLGTSAIFSWWLTRATILHRMDCFFPYFFSLFWRETTQRLTSVFGCVWVCLVEAGSNFSVQNGNPFELL